jgi:hypothetical protein
MRPRKPHHEHKQARFAGRDVVDTLKQRGQDVIPVSRVDSADVISGAGVIETLPGVDYLIDVSTGPSPAQAEATEFFTTPARYLHQAGDRAR